VRRLIINADDFGLTSGVNHAILEAHGHGVVTSATLMANASAFAGAVAMAQSAPRLGVGCHVVLVDGSPVLAASQIPRLVDEQNGARLRQGLSSFVLLAISGRLDPDQIEAEATEQIRKLQSAGIAVSHLDTHKHTHFLPQVLRPLLRAAQACGIRAVRNPIEPIRLAQLAERPALWKRWIEVKALHGFAGTFRRLVKETAMITPNGTFGIVATGALDERLFQSIVKNIPDGTWELVCHPGYDDAELQITRTRLLESRVRELQVLTSTATRDLLVRNGIQLISYRDLA
jgi:hopanoid biosynthesis associated protein HpnK